MSSRSFAQRSLAFVLAVCFWISSLCELQAQFQDLSQIKSEHLITNSLAGPTGDLTIYVSYPNWFARQSGYCPIRVRVVPKKGLAFKQDAELRIKIGNAIHRGGGQKVVVVVPIRAGESESTTEMLGNFISNYLSFETSLNGRVLNGQMAVLYNRGQNNEECKNLILISRESSALDRKWSAALQEMDKTKNWFSQESNTPGVRYSSVYADVDKLPDNWLALSCVGQVSIGCIELARLSASQLDCLNHYVLAGGQLVVSRVDHLEEVSKRIPIDIRDKGAILPISMNRSNPNDAIFEITARDFEPPILDLFQDTFWDQFVLLTGRETLSNASGMGGIGDPARYLMPVHGTDWDSYSRQLIAHATEVGRTCADSYTSSTMLFASHFYEAMQQTPVETSSSETAADEPRTKLTAPGQYQHGFGSVRLETRQVPDSVLSPSTLIATSLNRVSRFESGIGDDFWGWLIPSVGRTPAIPFLVFVLLFVGGAAPGLMFWCNRHRRRVWLVVLMPVLAAFCTICLFSYGLLKDGLGSVSRTRSLSFVDEKGNGLVWSRQCYFAGLVPNGGFRVGEETQLAPMSVNGVNTLASSEHWDDRGAQIYRGLLPPRLQSQFSITHPLREISIIKRDPQLDSVLNQPGIVNASSFDWNTIVLVDQQGQCFVAKKIAAGQLAKFSAVSKSDAEDALQREYKSQPLVAPEDAPSADQISLFQSLQASFFYSPSRSNSTGLIFEETIWKHHIGLNTPGSTLGSHLSPGTYCIFCEQAPYLERCLPNVVDRDSLHGIVGRW